MEQQRRRTTTQGRWAAIAVVTGAFLVFGPTTSLAALQMRTTRQPVAVGSAEPASSIVTSVSYGPRPEQLLDLYLPSGRTGPFPVIVYAHSGGWIAGSRTNVPDFILRQVGRTGIAVASIDYRLVTTAPDGSFVNSFPVPDQDVDRAVRFVRAHAATWNLDPQRVLLAGASAGGHLAALAAAAPGEFVDPTLPADLIGVSPRVDGVLDFVGISDFTTFGAAGGWAPGLMTAFLDCPDVRPDRCDPAAIAAASVATHLDASAPPAFLAYGTRDGLVPPETQAIPLAAAWAKARDVTGDTPLASSGVALVLADTEHNIDASTLDMAAMEAWIDTIIGPSASAPTGTFARSSNAIAPAAPHPRHRG
jgi:acetyl esterase/lipase